MKGSPARLSANRNLNCKEFSMTIELVLSGQRSWQVAQGECLQQLNNLADRSVALVFGSPPYAENGERYRGRSKKWRTADWIDGLLKVTRAFLWVSKGYVIWVANGAVRPGKYLPTCEGLIYKAHLAGLICARPCIWHKNAPPNHRDWYGNDWEFVLAFKFGTCWCFRKNWIGYEGIV